MSPATDRQPAYLLAWLWVERTAEWRAVGAATAERAVTRVKPSSSPASSPWPLRLPNRHVQGVLLKTGMLRALCSIRVFCRCLRLLPCMCRYLATSVGASHSPDQARHAEGAPRQSGQDISPRRPLTGEAPRPPSSLEERTGAFAVQQDPRETRSFERKAPERGEGSDLPPVRLPATAHPDHLPSPACRRTSLRQAGDRAKGRRSVGAYSAPDREQPQQPLTHTTSYA